MRVQAVGVLGLSATLAYLEAKVAQRCTYHGCKRAPADSSQLCPRHLRKQRKYDTQSKKRSRAANRAAGLCAFCPTPSKKYRCAACLVSARQVPKSHSVQNGVDKSARIAAATRTHADGRTRYHASGKRGSQPAEKLDAEDINWARAALSAGEAGLQMLATEQVKAMPRIQREDVKHAALHQIARAQGHLEDVLERRGHFKLRHGRRDGE